MTSLYELAAQHRQLADRLSDTNLDDQTIADTLEAESGDLMEKGTNVAKVLRNLESFAEQIKQAEQQMTERRKAIEKRAASLKQYLLTNMDMAGITKIESPWFCISIKNNPESVVIDDAVALPKEYMRETISYAPDKALMKSAMQDGFDVPGAHLERGKRLEIR
jgi:hypothetical protein